ncbi:hypothetical protein A2467_02615 [Candidatus Nomurabacteria bacterium RIFOXYC2_FULL_36_8]|nr:MAG: hypothetical protein UR97_C0007G0048 [Candidatus Nomurabacteria bacterium GW2011_GWE2_36_115]KKP93452.1 MAG: hypothetical protein US00_C0007G0074 [Candidatus Nomurabacteria bacterium GW2011_GWF2_36_126]KKP96570.1 MAG: hypothetical protein US04_C0001G0072 [Candidatus Nomurabacteria bacterium GW2011_GWD2_36_14]KKP99825.1 MAG: hypothetical protein US08_C0001G0508 [Candidatus Nomurabacteria bacterium GW2011_GWF2_36_19]KKQ05135.1 MAG: hypothetical protein US17_C0007G0048 [Candidatus Nomuraba
MIGVFLAAIGTFFDEFAISAGRSEVFNKKENIYTFGFLNFFWIFILLIIMAIVKNSFLFDIASIPLMIIFIILEILQVYISLHATIEADRSTCGFLMITTIPLLLIIDTFLGYKLEINSLIGIFILVIGLIILLLNHGINKKGIGYVIFMSINAAVTISIYKYCITHYNSVESQYIITLFFILIFLLVMSFWKYKENPIKYLFKRKLFFESFPRGISGVLISFAYLYAPASVITSVKRGFSVLWSIISGNKIFHEKHLVIKIISFVLIITGLVFMVF